MGAASVSDGTMSYRVGAISVRTSVSTVTLCTVSVSRPEDPKYVLVWVKTGSVVGGLIDRLIF